MCDGLRLGIAMWGGGGGEICADDECGKIKNGVRNKKPDKSADRDISHVITDDPIEAIDRVPNRYDCGGVAAPPKVPAGGNRPGCCCTPRMNGFLPAIRRNARTFPTVRPSPHNSGNRLPVADDVTAKDRQTER